MKKMLLFFVLGMFIVFGFGCDKGDVAVNVTVNNPPQEKDPAQETQKNVVLMVDIMSPSVGIPGPMPVLIIDVLNSLDEDIKVQGLTCEFLSTDNTASNWNNASNLIPGKWNLFASPGTISFDEDGDWSFFENFAANDPVEVGDDIKSFILDLTQGNNDSIIIKANSVTVLSLYLDISGISFVSADALQIRVSNVDIRKMDGTSVSVLGEASAIPYLLMGPVIQ